MVPALDREPGTRLIEHALFEGASDALGSNKTTFVGVTVDPRVEVEGNSVIVSHLSNLAAEMCLYVLRHIDKTHPLDNVSKHVSNLDTLQFKAIEDLPSLFL